MEKKLILLTQPEFFDGEAELLNTLFRHGLPLLHLRKPGATAAELSALIAQIAPEFRDRIALHNHDIHSCHTLEEVLRRKETLKPTSFSPLNGEGTRARPSYLFLSPIFDSISKQGYHSAFTAEELRRAHRDGIIDNHVVALGGITPTRAREALALGFGGVAILGDIWQSPDPVARLEEYKKMI